MNSFIFLRFIHLFLFGIILFSIVNTAESNCDKKKSESELNKILKDHEDWLAEHKRGKSLKNIDLDCLAYSSSLKNADLRRAILVGVDLGYMDLSNANLSHSNLTKARLDKAKLLDANLEYAVLTDASLIGAQMNRANLYKASLKNANLGLAILIETQLSGTILTGANFRSIDLEKAFYEPIGLPDKDTLSQIKNLATVTFSEGQQSFLVELRAVLKANGLRNLERQATYAIEKGKTKHFSTLERWFKTVLFDWTCQYGLKPYRSIYLIFILIPLYAFLYFFVIYNQLPGLREHCIVKDWEKENNKYFCGEQVPDPEIITQNNPWNSIKTAVLFSVYSASEIGWGEFTIGDWLKRLQYKEYTLYSYGWVRTVSGIQSLVSTYLLAITILSYFGRPFG